MSAATLAFDIIGKDKASGAFDKAGKSADGFGEKLKGLKEKTKGLMEGIGIGGGLALGAGIVGALDIDAANAKLKAQLGATVKEAGKFGRIAANLYKGDWGDSMDQVNEALASVVQNIGGMRKASAANLQAISGDVLNVASVFDQDLGGVTRAVGQMMKTGLAKNAKEALDIITVGMQKGANKADDLLDTFNEYGTQFRKLGLDGKTALGLIQQGLKGGARDADVVADSLKEFSIRAVDGSKSTALAFEGLGLNFHKMEERIAKGGPRAAGALQLTLDKLKAIKDPAKQSRLAVALFGTQAEDMGKALYSLDLDTAAKGLGKVGGAAKQVGDDVGNTASAQITSFKRNLEMTFVDVVGGKVIPAITEHKGVTLALVGAVGGLVGVVLAVNGAVAAWGAITAISTGVSATAAAVTTVWNNSLLILRARLAAGAAAQWLLNVAMDANPIALIVLGIAALAGGMYLAYKKSETFRGIINGLWGVLKSFGGFIGKVFVGYLKVMASMWLTVGEYGVKAFRFLLTAAFATFEGILLAADKGLGWVPGLGSKIHAAREAFTEFGDSTIEKLKGVEDQLHRTRDAINGLHDKTINIDIIQTVKTRGGVTHNSAGGHTPYLQTGQTP